ncbi:hypothetical protein [Biformimicrobium ophioploci]|uniref:MFS transporter n=1 Tax=Biformimicrobium ophioploci TaxID=3036711 RepID=A0ABQ6LWE9_9GAMM|nr:hypothetical protein [Microbulbifer sp. NKW57]GMG86429.1 hypothetical protein MNKW57_07500 [Microbulbifer sp. NKW57]
MNNRTLLILLVLVGYVFSPTMFTWMVNPGGAWYRPFIIWFGLILVAAYIQSRRGKDDL